MKDMKDWDIESWWILSPDAKLTTGERWLCGGIITFVVLSFFSLGSLDCAGGGSCAFVSEWWGQWLHKNVTSQPWFHAAQAWYQSLSPLSWQK